ncbi:MAG: hypothetical protein H6729_14325 [Deltaproteobacteria bacterium]|nr:hypothetical protein [Deltaproteobacteria bacterium]
MAPETMKSIALWLRARANPRYVLLPVNEYDSLAEPWGLPEWRNGNGNGNGNGND